MAQGMRHPHTGTVSIVSSTLFSSRTGVSTGAQGVLLIPNIADVPTFVKNYYDGGEIQAQHTTDPESEELIASIKCGKAVMVRCAHVTSQVANHLFPPEASSDEVE